MTNAILRGKPDAGNPHVRFDEGEVASAKPRRGSLLYNEDGFIIRAFNRLVRLLAASPLAALVLGLFVLVSGSAVCEYYMITLGRGTDVYYPWMSGTVVLGMLIWCAFFWRCLDFRWWSYHGWRFKLMTIRPMWLMGFMLSSFICLSVLFGVMEIEREYVKQDPAEFILNMDVLSKIISQHLGRLFWEVLFNIVVVAVISWLALGEDESRDKLAEQMGLHRR